MSIENGVFNPSHSSGVLCIRIGDNLNYKKMETQPNEVTCVEKEHEIYYAYDDECVTEMEVSMTIFVNTLPDNVYEGIFADDYWDPI